MELGLLFVYKNLPYKEFLAKYPFYLEFLPITYKKGVFARVSIIYFLIVVTTLEMVIVVYFVPPL